MRVELIALRQIEGIVPLGTSLDYESERTRKLGCWDGAAACTGPIEQWTTTQKTPDFEPDDGYCNFLIDIGFGKNCDDSVREFWKKTIKGNYQGGTVHHPIFVLLLSILVIFHVYLIVEYMSKEKDLTCVIMIDDGRRRARMAAINLRERDGLHGRLFDVGCPVMWLHVSGLPQSV